MGNGSLGEGSFIWRLEGSLIEDSTGTERKEKQASRFARIIVDQSLSVLIRSRFEITEKQAGSVKNLQEHSLHVDKIRVYKQKSTSPSTIFFDFMLPYYAK